MNLFDFQNMKNEAQKIVLMTCYTHWAAKLLNNTDIDALLVGDSVAMVEYGFDSTLKATIEMMALHTDSVARGAPKKFIIADMPFLSYRKDLSTTMDGVHALMQAGANAIKLEGAYGNLLAVKHIVESGVPVMGHIGLTPQHIHQLGGYKVQGRGDWAAEALLRQALELESAGCFSLVLECVPAAVALRITKELTIPTIGIGAGSDTSGQVLVFHDALGLNDLNMRFVKRYSEGSNMIIGAMNTYAGDVKAQKFPASEHEFS
jgi:3-methyl-2-oxobutanoate hydroxymethyltransferase